MSSLVFGLLCFAGGLIVGWNFLAQPTWVKNLLDKIRKQSKFKPTQKDSEMAELKKVVTPVFRLSFPQVFEAEGFDGGAKKFSATAVWTPAKFSAKDKKRWKAMRALLDAESMSEFKKKIKDLPDNIRKGIRDGAEKADMEGYGDGTKFATLSSKMRPGVVDADREPIGPEHNNQDEIYPGCYCRATVAVYSYNNKGKGVALGLQNLQKVADGVRLDSRTDAAEDFEDDIDEQWLEDNDEDDDLDDDDETPF